MKKIVFSPYVQIFPLVFPRFSQRFPQVLPPRCQDEDDGPSFEPLDDLLPHGLAKKAWATSLDADDAAGAQDPESLGEGETSNGVLDYLL